MTIDTNKDPLNLGEIFSGLFQKTVKNLNFEAIDDRCSKLFAVHKTVL